MRVLLIRSHSLDAERNMAAFHAAGFITDHAQNAEEAFTFIRQYVYDIVILATQGAGPEGGAAVRRIREQGDCTPILVLCDRPSSDHCIAALRAGADDVLGGTYRAEELVAHVEAIVRRSRGYATPKLHVGPLTIDVTGPGVAIHGREVHLRPKELEILRLLALRRGRVVSCRQIVDLLYDGLSTPDEKIIRVFVCGLRKKLAKHGAAGLLETVHGFGYVVNPAARSAAATMVPGLATPSTEMRVH